MGSFQMEIEVQLIFTVNAIFLFRFSTSSIHRMFSDEFEYIQKRMRKPTEEMKNAEQYREREKNPNVGIESEFET